MKNKIAVITMALGLGLPAMNLQAQDGPRPPHGPRGGGRPAPPLVAALDANHDGVIDQSELNAAPEALRALDKNNDGKLTPDELRPADGPGPKPPGDAADNPHPPHDPAPNADGEGRPPRRPGSPIIAALDVNKDGVIDASEIANATEALKALDKNGDGKITMDEIRPPRPEGGHGGPGGPNAGGPRKHRPQPAAPAE